MEKGKSAEAIFTFVPRTLGTYEAFYIFHIKKYDLTTNFLLVGEARNPKVYFEKPHVTLKPTVLEVAVEEDILLKNDDLMDFEFKINKESTYSQGHQQHIAVHPLQGVLKAHSVFLIRLTKSNNRYSSKLNNILLTGSVFVRKRWVKQTLI